MMLNGQPSIKSVLREKSSLSVLRGAVAGRVSFRTPQRVQTEHLDHAVLLQHD